MTTRTYTISSEALFEEEFALPVKIECEIDYEPADYTDHPYGSTTAREYHPAVCQLLSAKLLERAELMDDDGNDSGIFIEAGTDMMLHPLWSKRKHDRAEEEINNKMDQEAADNADDWAADTWAARNREYD